MRIATLVKGTGADFEQRKLQLARRDMDQAYKKNAKYANASKNAMLLALENLLSGKTEKELHERDLATKQQEVFEEHLPREEKLQLPEVKQEVIGLVSTNLEASTHLQDNKVAGVSVKETITYTNVPNRQKYDIGREEEFQAPPTDSLQETIELLEKIHQAALAPTEPSLQDLRVAASAVAQIQEVRGELTTEVIEAYESDLPPFKDDSFDVKIPERFLKNVERNAEADTIFGKDLEKLLFNRTFNKAKTVYTNHIEMVKNSYHSYNEPLFSRTA